MSGVHCTNRLAIRIVPILLALGAWACGGNGGGGPDRPDRCADLPLRHEVLGHIGASLAEATQGKLPVGELGYIAPGMGAASLPFESYLRREEDVLLVQDQAELDAAEHWNLIADNMEVDWDTQTLAVVLAFPPEHPLQLFQDGDRLELHVSRPIACVDGDDVPLRNLFGVEIHAYLVPKVSTAKVVFHDGRYRIPSFTEDGTCRRDPESPILRGGGRTSVLQEASGYRMWFEGYSGMTGNVFETRSTDGITWTPGGWDENHKNQFEERGRFAEVYGPSVLRRAEGYWMFFATYDAWRELRGIRRVSSKNGIDWSEEVAVLEPSGSDETLEMPFVLEHDGRLWLWYTITRKGEPAAIALATSDDGESWSQVGTDPVLLPGPAGAFDEAGVRSPSVHFHDGQFTMWFQGSFGGHPSAPFYTAIGMATSPDGIHWTKYDQPILVARGGYEGGNLTGPRVLPDGDGYRLWYTGINRRSEPSIGHARCRPRPR